MWVPGSLGTVISCISSFISCRVSRAFAFSHIGLDHMKRSTHVEMVELAVPAERSVDLPHVMHFKMVSVHLRCGDGFPRRISSRISGRSSVTGFL